jgi:hypothetical protein
VGSSYIGVIDCRADFLIKLSKLALTRSIIDRHDIASKRIIPSKIRDRVLSSQIL